MAWYVTHGCPSRLGRTSHEWDYCWFSNRPSETWSPLRKLYIFWSAHRTRSNGRNTCKDSSVLHLSMGLLSISLGSMRFTGMKCWEVDGAKNTLTWHDSGTSTESNIHSNERSWLHRHFRYVSLRMQSPICLQSTNEIQSREDKF